MTTKERKKYRAALHAAQQYNLKRAILSTPSLILYQILESNGLKWDKKRGVWS